MSSVGDIPPLFRVSLKETYLYVITPISIDSTEIGQKEDESVSVAYIAASGCAVLDGVICSHHNHYNVGKKEVRYAVSLLKIFNMYISYLT